MVHQQNQREAIITTQVVSKSANGRAVELTAALDAGELAPGMFLHIPMNQMLDFTVPIKEVVPLLPPNVRIVLACGDDEEGANLVLSFNFDNETLWVNEIGET